MRGNVEHDQAGGFPKWFDVVGRNGGAISIGQKDRLGEIVLEVVQCILHIGLITIYVQLVLGWARRILG
jgi:hypothetical protein